MTENRTVVEVDFTYTDDLSPGQSGLFELTLLDEDRVALIESYLLEAESWQSVAASDSASMPWDITGPTTWVPDSKRDMRDVAQVAKLYGSVAGGGEYDVRADITGPTYLVADGKIDMRDVALVCKHFGEIY